MMRALVTAAAAVMLLASTAQAVEFEAHKNEYYTPLKPGLSVATIGQYQFVMSDLPSSAAKLQIVANKDELSGYIPVGIDPGDEMTSDEAMAAIRIYYEHTAFDKDSIRIRNFTMGKRGYAVWCSEFMFTCFNWEARAGTYVSYEVNGRNLSGGMTGYEERQALIRKVAIKTPIPPVTPN